jgi:DNA-directed RNA polymerase subunit M/transcription elongation factor TFIIS
MSRNHILALPLYRYRDLYYANTHSRHTLASNRTMFHTPRCLETLRKRYPKEPALQTGPANLYDIMMLIDYPDCCTIAECHEKEWKNSLLKITHRVPPTDAVQVDIDPVTFCPTTSYGVASNTSSKFKVYKCSCGSTRVRYSHVQLRSGDEMMDTVFNCRDCKRTWKQT